MYFKKLKYTDINFFYSEDKILKDIKDFTNTF